MKINGYLEHLDLGIDPETGERNILVQSPEEYRALPDDQKARAWATLKVASRISERTPASLYKAIYEGKLTPQTLKKRASDRRGLTLIKVPTVRTNEDKRKGDISRIVRVFRRTLRATCWLPEGNQVLIAGMVDSGLRNLERELFGTPEAAGINQLFTKEGNHENNKQEQG